MLIYVQVKCIEEEKAIADDEFVCKFKIGSWTYSSNLLLMEFYGKLNGFILLVHLFR